MGLGPNNLGGLSSLQTNSPSTNPFAKIVIIPETAIFPSKRFPVEAGNDARKTGWDRCPDRPQGFEGELFRLLFESAEIATFTPDERIKLKDDMRTERDLKNQIAYAKEEGRESTLDQVEFQLRERGMSETEIAALIQSVREATKITNE